jgi:hypothetical protein
MKLTKLGEFVAIASVVLNVYYSLLLAPSVLMRSSVVISH